MSNEAKSAEDRRRAEEVERPSHYTAHPSGVQCIEVAQGLTYCEGNAVKYLWRAGLKDPNDAETDLAKARWYIHRSLGADARVLVSEEDVDMVWPMPPLIGTRGSLYHKTMNVLEAEAERGGIYLSRYLWWLMERKVKDLVKLMEELSKHLDSSTTDDS